MKLLNIKDGSSAIIINNIVSVDKFNNGIIICLIDGTHRKIHDLINIDLTFNEILDYIMGNDVPLVI